MKMVDIEKTIEEIENDSWTDVKFPTNTVKRIYEIRKKRIKDFSHDDLRLAISQNVGVDTLIPLAIKILKQNILTEALYYPGDMLLTLLNVTGNFWKTHQSDKKEFEYILNYNLDKIKNSIEINEEIRSAIIKKIGEFLFRDYPNATTN